MFAALALATAALAAAAAIARGTRRRGDRRGQGRRCFRRRRLAAEERHDAAPESALNGLRSRSDRGRPHFDRHRRRRNGRGGFGHDALDHRFLFRPRALFLALALEVRRVGGRREIGGAFETRLQFVEARVVVAQPLDVVVRLEGTSFGSA